MVLENSSLKGVFGQNMSYPPKWSLTDDSLFLHAAILKEGMSVNIDRGWELSKF